MNNFNPKLWSAKSGEDQSKISCEVTLQSSWGSVPLCVAGLEAGTAGSSPGRTPAIQDNAL